MYEDDAYETGVEKILCFNCGYVMGEFGGGSKCILVCPRCKRSFKIIVTDEENVVVNRKSKCPKDRKAMNK